MGTGNSTIFLHASTVTRRGTMLGSVRPDFVTPDGLITIEVKNYNLNNIAGLTNSIARQAIQREVGLRAGAQQLVTIDTRGQVLTTAQKQNIVNQIMTKTRGIISEDQIEFKKD